MGFSFIKYYQFISDRFYKPVRYSFLDLRILRSINHLTYYQGMRGEYPIWNTNNKLISTNTKELIVLYVIYYI